MCPTCCKCLNDQHKVTAITVTLPTARNPDVRPELKEKFEEICRNRGIQKENILDFTKAGKFTSLWFPLPEILVLLIGKAREGNTCNRSPLPYLRKSFGFFLGNKGLVVDCAVFCLYRSLYRSPWELRSSGLQVGDD